MNSLTTRQGAANAVNNIINNGVSSNSGVDSTLSLPSMLTVDGSSLVAANFYYSATDYIDAIMYRHSPTFAEMKAAIDRQPDNLCLIKKQTNEICRYAIEKNALTIKFVRDQTFDLCVLAIENNQNTLKYIHNQTFELLEWFVLKYGNNSPLIDWDNLTTDQKEYLTLL